MASNGIRDRVAIVGMGCTSFGERWDKSVSDLLVDATKDATASAGIDLKDIDAFWLGTLFSGQSGLTLSRPLKIDYKPVSRLENYCATGSEAFRNACYAVASGAYDSAMAIGVEKLKDSGFSGLPSTRSVGDGTAASMTAPAMFSLLAPAYAKKYGVSDEQLKDVMTRIAWKNHKNGALNPRAQFRKEVPKDTIACSPLVAGALAVNPDGGLKSFGHPIGASGLRMLFECWLQLRGEAGKRQIASVARGRKLALTHNLGGAPGECVSFVSVVGSERS